VGRDRLPPETFDLPVERIRDGYYSDAYFNFAREALLAAGRRPHVTMQVFQRKEAILGGIDEAVAILRCCRRSRSRSPRSARAMPSRRGRPC
jgi:nicotinate phosphoribosyltransferase